MFIGACAGSTGGGIKCSRILLLGKSVKKELMCLIHPRLVRVNKMDGQRVPHEGDGVGLAQQVEALLGDLADDADAQTRAREGLTPDDFVGQTELGADGAHLILEQSAQRFDELELDVLGQAADVVVALDVGRAVAAAGFDDVGDDFALALRLGDACEGVEEVVGGVDGDEADAGRGDEVVLDLLDFALAQQAVVHEHAGELVADGLVYQSGGHGGINASQSLGSAAQRCRKFSISFWPSGECLTSGCHCTP